MKCKSNSVVYIYVLNWNTLYIYANLFFFCFFFHKKNFDLCFLLSFLEYCQVVSMCCSLLSIAFAVSSYENSLRMSSRDKNELSCCNLVTETLSRIFEIASRVLALGLFAYSVPSHSFAVAMFFHSVLMAFWIYCIKTNFSDNR